MESHNILEALPIVSSVARRHDLPYAVVGGTVTDALLDASTVIDSCERTVSIDDDFSIPLLRDNKTFKDIDLLGFTVDKAMIRNVVTDISAELHDEYPRTSVSLSGYEPHFLSPTVQLVSRTVHVDDGLYLTLGDVTHSLPKDRFEDTWTAVYRGNEFSILHPASHLGSYFARSITGVRPKDREKVILLANKLDTHFDNNELREHRVWREFASDIASRYSTRELLRRRDSETLRMVLGRVALRQAERHPGIVRLAQGGDGVLARIAHRVIELSRPGQATVLK